MLADKIIMDDSVQALASIGRYLVICTASICLSMAGFAWSTNTAIRDNASAVRDNANQIGNIIEQFAEHREDARRRLDRLEELLYNNGN